MIIKLRNRLVPLVTSQVIHIVNRKLICCRKSRVFALGASNWQKLIAKSFLEYFFTYKGINLYFWVYMPFKGREKSHRFNFLLVEGLIVAYRYVLCKSGYYVKENLIDFYTD